MAFEVESRDLDGVRLLSVSGKLDPRSVRQFRQTLLQSLSEGRRSLLLDLSRLEFIDGAGIRVLVTIDEHLEAEGGRLALCSLHSYVKKVFKVAGDLSRRFAIFPSRAQGVRWLEKSVRMARIARLAGSLLRKTTPGAAKKGYARAGPDVARLELAIRLLGLAEGSPQAVPAVPAED